MPRDTVYRSASSPMGGRVTVNPDFAPAFAALGIDSAAGFLDLPGEVVSGHPDRHVVRVELPFLPNAFYLKRQHVVGWRERRRNWRAGFGRVSRCEREAAILQQLTAGGLPCPRWAASGIDGSGRAFLMVEEAAGATDLRRLLSDTALSSNARARLADRLGRQIALIHATGFTTPDLTAKHVLVSARGLTILDWQSAERTGTVSPRDRVRALAALHASVADHLATPRERLRVLRAALQPARQAGSIAGRLSEFARAINAEAGRLGRRWSFRDQRQSAAAAQRLVWVASEEVCAVPDVAEIWPNPAVAAPVYGCQPGTVRVRLPDGREATLVRGRSIAPFARARALLRGRPWRSPGVTLGRVLFHLERYDVPAPRLFAFGQRLTGRASAEWFAMHAPTPAELPRELDSGLAEQLGRCLRKLHDAGCRVAGEPLAAFGLNAAGACLRDVRAIRLDRRASDDQRASELVAVLASLPPGVRDSARAGYRTPALAPPHVSRLTRRTGRTFTADVTR